MTDQEIRAAAILAAASLDVGNSAWLAIAFAKEFESYIRDGK